VAVHQVNWVTAHLKNNCPILLKLLCIIFSLAPSSAGAERNWSIQDFIVSKRRNRLTDARGTKLVAIYWNLRTLETAFKAAEVGCQRKVGIGHYSRRSRITEHPAFLHLDPDTWEQFTNWRSSVGNEFEGMHGDDNGRVDDDDDDELLGDGN
jgi:hypothetical protein